MVLRIYSDTLSQNIIRIIKARKGGLGGTYGTYEGKEQCVRLIFVQKCDRNRTDGRGRMEWIQLTESTVQ